jgi:hypothetical protein
MKCGAIFWMRLPFVGIRRALLSRNRTNCPSCGGTARVADGLFEFVRDGVAILSAPEVTYEMLLGLRALVQSAHQQQWSTEKLKEEAETISPAFGGLFAPSTWSPEVKNACIAAVAGLLIAYILSQQKPPVVNVQTIDPGALIQAIQGIPAEQLVEGRADDAIAARLEPATIPAHPKPEQRRILGPPKPNPKRKPRSKPKRKPKRKR